MITSILVYLLAGKIATAWRKPFVFMTSSLRLFPLRLCSHQLFLVGISIRSGRFARNWRTARKAMIVDFCAEDLRARSVGLYYLFAAFRTQPRQSRAVWRCLPKCPSFRAGMGDGRYYRVCFNGGRRFASY